MSAAAILILLALFLSLAMAGAWSIARHPGKSGWTDTIWSYAVGLAGMVAALAPASAAALQRRLLVGAMVGGWSLRLGTHILRRTLKGKDDPRYAALKAQWGGDWPRRLFLFLQIQAAAALFLVVAVLAAARNPASALAWSDWAGLALIFVAILGESIADRQLRAFVADPANRGKVTDRGLWAYSRHPNYFFEWLGWWAYPVIAIGPAAHWPWGWVALTGPALMYWLLVHASGIPPTEAHMLQSRGPAFRDYRKRVNAFFPGWRRPT